MVKNPGKYVYVNLVRFIDDHKGCTAELVASYDYRVSRSMWTLRLALEGQIKLCKTMSRQHRILLGSVRRTKLSQLKILEICQRKWGCGRRTEDILKNAIHRLGIIVETAMAGAGASCGVGVVTIGVDELQPFGWR